MAAFRLAELSELMAEDRGELWAIDVFFSDFSFSAFIVTNFLEIVIARYKLFTILVNYPVYCCRG